MGFAAAGSDERAKASFVVAAAVLQERERRWHEISGDARAARGATSSRTRLLQRAAHAPSARNHDEPRARHCWKARETRRTPHAAPAAAHASRTGRAASNFPEALLPSFAMKPAAKLAAKRSSAGFQAG
ncbi:hypothetical protein [Paraburkholderia sp. J41]|uniref:hypothetical protein n=1 Tax=Paraburkholderia sp. J41 TaxID=2805433 RepID=UPI002AC358CE|nr:hypothetical protein [Paraburkholderia sp. J41]